MSARAAQLGDGWSQMIVWGQQSHSLHNQAPISTQLTIVMEYPDIRYSDINYLYWFCECQSTHWGPMVSKWIVWGRAVHAYIIKTQLKHNDSCDGIHWHQYSDITTCIDSVSARAAQLGGRWSPNELCGGEQSHAYIITPNWTQLTHCDRNTLTSGTVTFLRVLILWVPGAAQLETDGLQMNCVRESSLMLNNQHPIETQCLLWWNTLTSGYSRHYYVYWFCECQSWRTGDDGLQMNCVRMSSLMLT